MNPILERAQLLIQQRRTELAAEELTRVLADDPDDAFAHVLFVDCLVMMDRYDDALEHGQRAVNLAPEWSLAHRALALALYLCDQDKKALTHAREAVRLDPEDADHYSLLAEIYASLSKWKQALETADRGLALNAEHSDCLNQRANALTKLGRREEAVQSMHGALARDPENAQSHASLGWTLLHQGKRKEALHHFREALRLNPQNSWARAGMVEALKAGNPIYALMLRYFLWMAGFSGRTRMMLVFGALFGYQVIARLMASSPTMAPYVEWVALAYITFVMMTWVADPCFNLILRLHPTGKYALFHYQIHAANWFGAGVLLSTGVVVLMALDGRTPGIWDCLFAFFLLFPINVAAWARPGAPRILAGAVSLLALLLLLASLRLPGFFGFYILLAIATTWVGNFVPRAKPDYE